MREKNDCHAIKTKRMPVRHSLVIIVCILTSFQCNKAKENYPEPIKENNLEEVYDLAKWNLYHLNYRISGQTEEGSSIPLIYSSPILESWDLGVSDSIKLYFSHFFENKVLLVEQRPYCHTLILKDTMLLEVGINGNASWDKEYLNYFLKLTEKEYHSLLRQEKNKIDKWLYREALRRGIFSE
jgi:hypothetical protein